MTWRTDPRMACKDLNELDAPMLKAVKNFLAAATKKGFRVLVYETVRTDQRQEYLHGQGRTRPGAIITYTLDSVHRYRRAVDLVPLNPDGSANWNGYAALYKAVPPGQFGLELLSFEKPHLQWAGFNGKTQNVTAAVYAKAHGLHVAYPKT
jgi:peptidoglycan LD-endopeptidase CwlK